MKANKEVKLRGYLLSKQDFKVSTTQETVATTETPLSWGNHPGTHQNLLKTTDPARKPATEFPQDTLKQGLQ